MTLSDDDDVDDNNGHHVFLYISLTSTARLRRETSQYDVLSMEEVEIIRQIFPSLFESCRKSEFITTNPF